MPNYDVLGLVNRKELYGKGVHGTRTWLIGSRGGTIHIFANGSEYTEIITEGKAGKTIEEQVQLRINARVRSKLDSGFKKSLEELKSGPTNQLNLPLPMLATPLKNVKNIRFVNCFIQPKLDGHRCIIANIDSEIIAYSRAGRYIDTIPHILDGIDIPPGAFLDGELYHHGSSLQTISSWAKRKQSSTELLKFCAYDMYYSKMPNADFVMRYRTLKKIATLKKLGSNTELVDTVPYLVEKELTEYFLAHRSMGYEGSILRVGSSIYGVGKRSKGLIKIKDRNPDKRDSEFEIVDMVSSREGLGILVLITESGLRFKTLAPGTNHEKKQALINKEKYIGREVTCEHADFTDSGKPQHCAAIRYKEHL